MKKLDALNRFKSAGPDYIFSRVMNKCVAMRYGGKCNVDWFYKIGMWDLNYSDKIRGFGVMFESSLKFNIHIQDKINKCFSLLGLIARNFNNLTKDAFLLLYK